jgi:hypothetical protein
MDGKVSFTCGPYLLETAPKLGDSIAWGESNAVIYATVETHDCPNLGYIDQIKSLETCFELT